MAYTPLRRAEGRLFDFNLNRMLKELYGMSGGDVAQAERVVLSTYGDTVSVADKAKNLNKFGRRDGIGTSFETIAEFPSDNETYPTTNVVDAAVSSNASDTQTITVEGHTLDGVGNLTFSTQQVTLTGQTPVALSPALARANRAFINSTGTFGSAPSDANGTISIYDDADGATSGVPDTDSAVKLTIQTGETQSQKCATSISAQDYWFVSYFSAAIGEAGKSADYVTVRVESRDVKNGGLWRPLGRNIVLSTSQPGRLLQFSPFLIVPPSHDIRVRARTDNNQASVDAEVGGYLASVTA